MENVNFAEQLFPGFGNKYMSPLRKVDIYLFVILHPVRYKII